MPTPKTKTKPSPKQNPPPTHHKHKKKHQHHHQHQEQEQKQHQHQHKKKLLYWVLGLLSSCCGNKEYKKLVCFSVKGWWNNKIKILNFWWFACIKESDIRYSILLLQHHESKNLKYVLLTFESPCSLCGLCHSFLPSFFSWRTKNTRNKPHSPIKISWLRR
jgi:hypothetical protein